MSEAIDATGPAQDGSLVSTGEARADAAKPFEPSPVPADAYLWPGELPFTAFGQFGPGHLDLRVFDQDTWWVDVNGTAHRLEEMTFEYRANVIMFLREHAVSYQAAQALRAMAQTAGNAVLGLPAVPGLDVDEIVDTAALVWLESTPLMRRLRQLTADA